MGGTLWFVGFTDHVGRLLEISFEAQAISRAIVGRELIKPWPVKPQVRDRGLHSLSATSCTHDGGHFSTVFVRARARRALHAEGLHCALSRVSAGWRGPGWVGRCSDGTLSDGAPSPKKGGSAEWRAE